MSVEIISGPPVEGLGGMDKEAAEKALLRNPSFPKGADYKLQALQGQWIAAVSIPDFQKQAEFPPSDGEDDGAPAGPPKGDDGPPSDDGGSDGPPSDDGGDSDGPPKEHGDKGDKGGLHALEQKIDMLMQALGIDPSMMGGDSMIPGPDGPPPGHGGPPPGGPMGHGGPPPPHGGPGGPDAMVHERAMKPGETPPGGTPIGANAFASVNLSKVQKEHPWGHLIGKTAHFTVREDIGQEKITNVHDELQSLAASGGFKVSRFTPMHGENGERIVEAIISAPPLPE